MSPGGRPDRAQDDRVGSCAPSGSGAARYTTDLAVAPAPDLLVVGSVVVSRAGARTGKGEGYGEIEYALLHQFGKIDAATPVATTVHDLQVVDALPLEPFDVTVDLIVTPTLVLRADGPAQRPDRIDWELLPDEKRAAIPLLREMGPPDTPLRRRAEAGH